jgi:hypothetical protein
MIYNLCMGQPTNRGLAHQACSTQFPSASSHARIPGGPIYSWHSSMGWNDYIYIIYIYLYIYIYIYTHIYIYIYLGLMGWNGVIFNGVKWYIWAFYSTFWPNCYPSKSFEQKPTPSNKNGIMYFISIPSNPKFDLNREAVRSLSHPQKDVDLTVKNGDFTR